MLLEHDGQQRCPARDLGAIPAPVIDLARADAGEAGEGGLADVDGDQECGKLIAGGLEHSLLYRTQFHIGRNFGPTLEILTRDNPALQRPMDFCLD